MFEKADCDDGVTTARIILNDQLDHQTSNVFLVDVFIHFLLALNKKFNLPKDNLVLNEILLNMNASHKTLSEYLIKILNLESRLPLSYIPSLYKMKKKHYFYFQLKRGSAK